MLNKTGIQTPVRFGKSFRQMEYPHKHPARPRIHRFPNQKTRWVPFTGINVALGQRQDVFSRK